ncbi:ATP-dependent helicase C-terminal domain-containing protein [Streptomyces sp. H10-C2]|uniref:ATP-dependent RNA helicase n=1 Tax=unclassified Streptomyces TaxID=2593676 RepID=UPI0024B8FA10|nr:MULTISPECIES: ATP-dependent helicase C-terminal domain-containing protein [unclassified Streptomyces]MDJ0346907.1 ATP-dependent helicase C-terminal domain-containing protein [Streptomyces sp. PH10-H1]MDJ0375238.1 ATP-dependent helicase C-terminal domain-containing protein [Streptomyces sp. H10-C2]
MIRADALDLPVRTVVPALLRALDERGCAVLAAPPGTGKTTLVPLALAGLLPQYTEYSRPTAAPRRVLVAEPRRMAVRAAARRMAWLLGESVGARIGFTVRGERKVSAETVVEVVTTGVLLQRLQRDPELAGVDTVVLDECHERHLDADTSMAFLLDVRATLRPELRVVAASATTDTAAWAALIGSEDGAAPVVEAQGILHPVAVEWAPPPRPVRPPHGMRVDPALLEHVAAVVRRGLREREGDVLCFLPGVGEIARVAGMLNGPAAGLDVEVLQLHGRAPAAVQDAALAPGTRRRVLLATSVAESSLTVPGVRIVVDGGLAREPRVDHARGLDALTTVRVSHAAARQRAGRAGREGPGTVYRCWSEADNAGHPRWPAPEISVADLTAFALQAACWGDPDATGLALLDAPPAGAMSAAREVLGAVGAVSAGGRATGRGLRLSRLGVHPRLARALLDGARAVGSRHAAEIVALLSEEPPRDYGDDLAAAWRQARRGGDGYAARWRAEAGRLESSLRQAGSDGGPGEPGGPDGSGGSNGSGRSGRSARSSDSARTASPQGGTVASGGSSRFGGSAAASAISSGDDDAVAGLVAALAFPERVARGRGAGTYLMASGTAAELRSGSRLGAAGWLAIAVADRPVAAASARVRLAAVIDEATARTAAAPLLTSGEEVRWADGDVVARSVERLGAVELTARPLRSPDRSLVRAAVAEGLRREGTGLLRWSRDAQDTRRRLAFLHRVLGEPWPDVSESALLGRMDDWLGPELSAARRRADLERIDAGGPLARLLPWATGDAGRFAELAPERIEVPSGSRIRVDYKGDQPVLAAKLQELFGWQETPRIAGGRVPLLVHLLSPAGRPAAVTADLASFWKGGYRSVRAELRGRYPKHPWPEDPAAAAPTRRTNNRR